jgi:hypothetical protein
MSVELDWGGLEIFSVGVGVLPDSLKEFSVITNGRSIILGSEDNRLVSKDLEDFFIDVGICHSPQELILRRVVARAVQEAAEAMHASIEKQGLSLVSELSHLSERVKALDRQVIATQKPAPDERALDSLASLATDDTFARHASSIKRWLLAVACIGLFVLLLAWAYLVLVVDVRMSNLTRLMSDILDLLRK